MHCITVLALPRRTFCCPVVPGFTIIKLDWLCKRHGKQTQNAYKQMNALLGRIKRIFEATYTQRLRLTARLWGHTMVFVQGTYLAAKDTTGLLSIDLTGFRLLQKMQLTFLFSL